MALIGVRMRVLLFEALLDIHSFVAALRTAMAGGQLALARALAEACKPAWAARLAACGLAELEAARDPRPALEELQGELEQAASRGRDMLLALGRMASPIALIGVIVEMGNAAHGGGGLLGLQRGLVARIAMQRAVLTVALGLGTSAVCFVAAAILQRSAATLRRDLTQVRALFDAPEGGGEM